MVNWTEDWEEILKTTYLNTNLTTFNIYKKLKERGFDGTYGSVDRKIRRMIEEKKMKKRFDLQCWEGLKVGYLDIETTGLFADIHYMLSWAIKERGVDKVHHDTINRKDILSFKFDENILKTLIKAMDKFDVIVGFNSTRFDLPFILARCEKLGIKFPPYGSFFHQDVYFMAKRLFKITRKSLKVVCEHLGIVGKTPLPRDVWQKATLGDPKSLKYILEHNIADVEITEKVHRRLEQYGKAKRRSF